MGTRGEREQVGSHPQVILAFGGCGCSCSPSRRHSGHPAPPLEMIELCLGIYRVRRGGEGNRGGSLGAFVLRCSRAADGAVWVVSVQRAGERVTRFSWQSFAFLMRSGHGRVRCDAFRTCDFENVSRHEGKSTV